MNTTVIYSLKASRHITEKLVKLSKPMLPIDCAGQPASDLIKTYLSHPQPTMICRFGILELKAILRYLSICSTEHPLTKLMQYLKGDTEPFWWDKGVKRVIFNQAGVFPPTEAILERFAQRMLEDIGQADILGSWLPGEVPLRSPFFPNAKIVPLGDLEPYYHRDPWTEALTGKTVLIIHPFESSIRSQYAKRRALFADARVLPDFELKTLKAVQSAAGNPVMFRDWFVALDWMCEQIDAIEFDVAVIGAGAYGLPLAAYVKSIGKHGIHLGGPTQLWFGIKGKRWDRLPFFQQLYNDHWVRPQPMEAPKNHKTIESGCYW